jgi:chromosome segregation ATPase
VDDVEQLRSTPPSGLSADEERDRLVARLQALEAAAAADRRARDEARRTAARLSRELDSARRSCAALERDLAATRDAFADAKRDADRLALELRRAWTQLNAATSELVIARAGWWERRRLRRANAVEQQRR